MKPFRLLTLPLAVALLAACSVTQVAVDTTALVQQIDDTTYLLNQEVAVGIPKAADAVLKAGTSWKKIGSIAEGNVYHTEDQVVIVNSFNVHEADVVVDNGMVVGFYLSAQRTFVQSIPTSISLQSED